MTHKNQLKRKIVFIGDSIINGFPLKRSLCFVSLFRGLTGHEVINKGENGETSAVILARFEEDALAHKPHSIAIHAGGNDLFRCLSIPIWRSNAGRQTSTILKWPPT
jgi:lysophospholipase L1-like esterase